MPGGFMTFDLATQTGWAHADPEALDQWPDGALAAQAYTPAFDVGHKRFGGREGGGALGLFADDFHEWTHAQLVLFNPSLVAFEAPFVGRKTSQQMGRKLMGLAWHLEWLCKRLHIPCEEVDPTQWRRHFMNRGSGSRAQLKDLSLAECFGRGWLTSNDDEADALGILDYAVACRWRNRRVA